jgi:hypothetical protein
VLSAFGELDSLEILRTKTGNSRGIAVAQYLQAEDARRAMALHGSPLTPDASPLRVSYVPLHAKGTALEPVDECVVVVDGPDEQRTAAAIAGLFSQYHSGALEIAVAAQSVVVFPRPDAAARCAAEFTHPELSVYTFGTRSAWAPAIAILAQRTAFVSGYSPDDFELLPALFPSGAIERTPGKPSAFVRFETAAECERAIATANGQRLGALRVPIRVLPFAELRLPRENAIIIVVYEPSLSLTESALLARFSAARPIAAAVTPTIHGDSYGVVLFREGDAPPVPDGLRISEVLNESLRAFSATRERIVVVRDAQEAEFPGTWTRISDGAAIARFADADAVAEALRAIAAAGKEADIFSDQAFHLVERSIRNRLVSDSEEKTVLVSKLPQKYGNVGLKALFAEFGEIEFSAVFHRPIMHEESKGCGVVRFGKREAAERAIAGPLPEEIAKVEVTNVATPRGMSSW